MATILLVDGDPLQAFLHVSVLQRHFSDVRRVQSAAEALCLVEQPQFAEKLGLVISGHHLPGLDGREFVAELRQRLPKLRVLVLGDSGAADPASADAQVSFVPSTARSEEIVRQAEYLLGQIRASVCAAGQKCKQIEAIGAAGAEASDHSGKSA